MNTTECASRSVVELGGERAVEVLVLLLERQHEPLEASIQLPIDDQPIPADDPVDELPVPGVVAGVVALGQVVDPVVLRVVLDVGVYAVDALDHREVLLSDLVVVVGLQREARLRLHVHQPVDPERQLAQPRVLVLQVVVLQVGTALQRRERQLREVLHSDGTSQHLDQPEGVAVVVDGGAVEGRPDLQHGHAARPQSLVGQQLETDVAGTVGVDLLEHLVLVEEGLRLGALVSGRGPEVAVLALALHLVEVVHDAQRGALERVAVGSDQAVVQRELQLAPPQVLTVLPRVHPAREVRQAADVQVLEALVEVAQRRRHGLQVGQRWLQQRHVLLDDGVEDAAQVEHLQGHVVADLGLLLQLPLSLLAAEVDVEELDLSEGIDKLERRLLGLGGVGGQLELLSFVVPPLVAALLGLEGDAGERLLALVVDDVARVDLEGAVEAVELHPHLLLQHQRRLLRRRKQDLVGLVGLGDQPLDHLLALQLRFQVLHLDPAVGQHDLEDILFAALAGVEQDLDLPERRGQFPGWVVEELLVVLLDEDDAGRLALELVDLGAVNPAVQLVSIHLLPLPLPLPLRVETAREVGLDLAAVHRQEMLGSRHGSLQEK